MKRVSVRQPDGSWRRGWLVSESGGTGFVQFLLGGPVSTVPMTAIDRDGWAKCGVKEEAS